MWLLVLVAFLGSPKTSAWNLIISLRGVAHLLTLQTLQKDAQASKNQGLRTPHLLRFRSSTPGAYPWHRPSPTKRPIRAASPRSAPVRAAWCRPPRAAVARPARVSEAEKRQDTRRWSWWRWAVVDGWSGRLPLVKDMGFDMF